MRNIITATVLAVIVGFFVGAYAFRGLNPSEAIGAASDCFNGYTCFTKVNVLEAFQSDGDATVSGGSLRVPTVANATSTIVTGCFQFYATSSFTPVKLDLIASASTTVNAATSPFVVAANYGTCPNL